MANPILKITDMSAAYGGIRALDGISLEVGRGEIVAVLGANGAGKSTLLKCLSGEHKIMGGSVEFDGEPLPSKSHNIVQKGMVIVPEGRQIFYRLTVYDNLMIGCCQRKDQDGINQDLEMVYKMFPRLKERTGQYGGTLSGGEQQMLAIGRGLMARPTLLMLDEPSLGLAPIIVTQIMETLRSIADAGTTILLVEQNAGKSLAISDRAYVLETGSIVLSGIGADLAASDEVKKAYLGG